VAVGLVQFSQDIFVVGAKLAETVASMAHNTAVPPLMRLFHQNSLTTYDGDYYYCLS